MAYGSGLGASVGVGEESVYGTYVAPSRFFAAKSFNVKKVQNTVPIGGVAAGRIAAPDEVVTTTAASGQIQADVLRKDFGLLLAHLMGSTATPVQQAATAAYLQTHNWGDSFGRSLTMQGGLPTTAGTVVPKTLTGCKITQGTFSCAVDGLVESTFDFDAKVYTESETLAAPSYTASNMPFHFGEFSVRLGSFGSESVVQGVRSANLTIPRPMDLARFYGGNGGTKSEPITAGELMKITGTLEVDHVTAADFNDRFINHTATSLVVEWVGTTAIASTYFPTLRFTMPKVYFRAGIDEVSGPEIIKASVPFEAFLDSTNGLVTAEYLSTDTAV